MRFPPTGLLGRARVSARGSVWLSERERARARARGGGAEFSLASERGRSNSVASRSRASGKAVRTKNERLAPGFNPTHTHTHTYPGKRNPPDRARVCVCGGVSPAWKRLCESSVRAGFCSCVSGYRRRALGLLKDLDVSVGRKCARCVNGYSRGVRRGFKHLNFGYKKNTRALFTVRSFFLYLFHFF